MESDRGMLFDCDAFRTLSMASVGIASLGPAGALLADEVGCALSPEILLVGATDRLPAVAPAAVWDP